MRKCRNWQTSKTKDLVTIAVVWVQVPSSAVLIEWEALILGFPFLFSLLTDNTDQFRILLITFSIYLSDNSTWISYCNTILICAFDFLHLFQLNPLHYSKNLLHNFLLQVNWIQTSLGIFQKAILCELNQLSSKISFPTEIISTFNLIPRIFQHLGYTTILNNPGTQKRYLISPVH